MAYQKSRSKVGSAMLPPPFLKRIHFEKNAATEQSYPFTVPLFQKDFLLEFSKPITLFIGENGTGKSTLLEFIAFMCGFNLQGGSRSHQYKTQGVESFDHLNQLNFCMRFSWLPKITEGFFLRAETFFNFLEYIHQPDWHDIEKYYGGNLLKKSHGESFLTFFTHQLDRRGIYLLDEPEAALSPARQLDFLRILKQIEARSNAQVIMVTHSPLLMAYPNADVLRFEDQGIVKAHFEQSEHFQLNSKFYKNPRAFIDEILE